MNGTKGLLIGSVVLFLCSIGTLVFSVNQVSPIAVNGTRGIQGVQGNQGPVGPQGIQGEPGSDGDDGIGIQDVRYNDYTGKLTIYLADGSSYTTDNIKGPRGIPGIIGPKGDKGDKGDLGDNLIVALGTVIDRPYSEPILHSSYGVDNVTWIPKPEGFYTIDFSKIAFSGSKYIALVTPISRTPNPKVFALTETIGDLPGTGTLEGKLCIRIFDTEGQVSEGSFQFVVFRDPERP